MQQIAGLLASFSLQGCPRKPKASFPAEPFEENSMEKSFFFNLNWLWAEVLQVFGFLVERFSADAKKISTTCPGDYSDEISFFWTFQNFWIVSGYWANRCFQTSKKYCGVAKTAFSAEEHWDGKHFFCHKCKFFNHFGLRTKAFWCYALKSLVLWLSKLHFPCHVVIFEWGLLSKKMFFLRYLYFWLNFLSAFWQKRFHQRCENCVSQDLRKILWKELASKSSFDQNWLLLITCTWSKKIRPSGKNVSAGLPKLLFAGQVENFQVSSKKNLCFFQHFLTLRQFSRDCGKKISANVSKLLSLCPQDYFQEKITLFRNSQIFIVLFALSARSL